MIDRGIPSPRYPEQRGHWPVYSHRRIQSRSPAAGQGQFGLSVSRRVLSSVNGGWRPRPWRTFEAVEFATLEWVDWFNNRRLLEPIGFIPPAGAEARYFAMLNDPAMAA